MGRWQSPLNRPLVAAASMERLAPERLRATYALRRQLRYERSSAATLQVDPRHLQHFEDRRYSQNGEDGIIAEILRRIGAPGRTFIEIGASDGHENCTRALVEDGWSGVWVEGDEGRAEEARRVVGHRNVTVVNTLLEPADASEVLDGAGAPAEPDVLVVDIDGNDAWMWRAVAETRRPRVVVIEVNARVGPRLRWSLSYRPGRAWDETARHGASLPALAALGRELGYDLVGCDSLGVNAFFVRHDLAAPLTSYTARQAWVPPRYALPYGHPWRAAESFDTPPLGETAAQRLLLRLHHVEPGIRPSGRLVFFGAAVTNRTEHPVGESRQHPLRVAAWWEDRDGHRLPGGEPSRSHQAWCAPPGRTAHLVCAVPAPVPATDAVLVAALVEEGIQWLDGVPSCAVRRGGWTIVPSPDERGSAGGAEHRTAAQDIA